MLEVHSCDKCGACCKNLSIIFMELDRGGGVCKYLTDDNLCSIYDNRPVFCRSDVMYEKYYSKHISRKRYGHFVNQACRVLQLRQIAKENQHDF